MDWLKGNSIELGGVRLHPVSLLLAVAIVFVGFLIASKLAARIRGGDAVAETARWRGTVAQLAGYVVRVGIVAMALQVAGIDIGSLLAAGAVVAVGVGIAMQNAEGMEARDQTRTPIVLLLDFGASSVDFEVSIWTRDVWGFRRGQSELRKAVWFALKRAGITIPFPQLDVHWDRPSAAAAASGSGHAD